jgi:hypothetical protein
MSLASLSAKLNKLASTGEQLAARNVATTLEAHFRSLVPVRTGATRASLSIDANAKRLRVTGGRAWWFSPSKDAREIDPEIVRDGYRRAIAEIMGGA